MIIDLSVTLNEHTPVYPGDPALKIAATAKFEADGYTDHLVSFGTHVGTHIDAPLHMLPAGAALDTFPAEQFVGQGHCIAVTAGDFSGVMSAAIQPGDIVLLCSGASDKYTKPEYFKDYPIMPTEVADYLVSKAVKMVGVDACSVDKQEAFPIHKTLLASNVLIIENLVNLRQLIGKSFKVYALPLKLQLDGAPARVIAELAGE